MRTLVIGYGNTLRGDDGLGVYAVEQLAQQSSDLDLVTCHQLTPELVEIIKDANQVIFIDAEEGVNSGEIREYHIEPDSQIEAFNHHVSPAALLSAVYDLYGIQVEGYLFSICGSSFDYSETLSPVAAAALPALIDRVIVRISGKANHYARV
jgi:hydrogenase maturation protease